MTNDDDRLMRFERGERLGSGGNGVVWAATHPDHGEVALKLLKTKNPQSESYRRFVREVEVQRGLTGRPGVLPLLDAHLPEQRGQAWLATPRAQPFDRTRAKVTVEEWVTRLADLAETLAGLHADGLAHRDIKPGNLFMFEDGAVFGDFGLVDDPGGDDITADIGVLGPRHYVAWEVLDDPSADWRPADVYALAKTAWVLLTGQRFPQPGPHASDAVLSQVSRYTGHPWSQELDQILAAATDLDARMRISAHEMAMSLRQLGQARPQDVAQTIDQDALRRLTERLKPATTVADQRNVMITRTRELALVIDEILTPMQTRVRDVAPFQTETGNHLHSTALLGWRTAPDEVVPGRDVLDTHALGYWAFTDDPRFDWSLTGGVALELRADGTLRVLGLHAALRAGAAGYASLGEVREEVEIRSPRSETVCRDVAERVASRVESALALWSRKLSGDD